MNLKQISEQLSDLHRDIVRSHPPELMTPREAANYLSITNETLLRWRKDCVGPKYSQPNSRIVRYLRDDLVEFVKEHQ
jgi:hypothetical protein